MGRRTEMAESRPHDPRLPAFLRWTWQGRLLVFVLSSTSIWCLLAEFYGLCSMRLFTFAVLVPATIALVAVGAWDRARGRGQLASAVWVGALAGFIAACAYDVFRLPFVFSNQW